MSDLEPKIVIVGNPELPDDLIVAMARLLVSTEIAMEAESR